MLVEGHLDYGSQVAFVEWFQDVAERFGDASPIYRHLVRVSGQIHDRQVIAVVNHIGSGDPVHLTLEADVHQHQVRVVFFG